MRGIQGDRIRHEWRQNARLRWGVLVVVLILGTRAILAVSDSRVEIARQYARDVELLGRLEATAAETDWPRRARAAEASRTAMLRAIPEARSEGAARADLQARLDQLGRDAALTDVLVRVETVLDVPGYPELRQAVGRLEGSVVTPLEVAPVARVVAAGQPRIHGEQFKAREGQPVPDDAIVRAFYRKPGLLPPAPGAGAKPASQAVTGARPAQDGTP